MTISIFSRRKCPNNKGSKTKLLLVFFVLVFFIFVLLNYMITVNPILISSVEFNTKQVATKAVNSSITEVIQSNIVYDDLVNILTDEMGNITMIQAKSMEINNLTNDLAVYTEQKIMEFGSAGVKIPMGNFSGINMLAGMGPNVHVKVEPIGAVICEFSSKFEFSGINQTLHRLYISITTKLGVVIPFFNKNISTSQSVLICENIIVGQVPEVYLYSDNLDTLLNFVPY